MGSKSVHWSFWIIGAVALIWNVMGCMNLFMQMSPEMLAAMPESHRQIAETRPVWATVAFAVSVVGGALGGLLLLLRKSTAYYLFIASLLGTILTMVHAIGFSGAVEKFSTFELFLGIFMPLVVAALLVWYSKRAVRKSWIG